MAIPGLFLACSFFAEVDRFDFLQHRFGEPQFPSRYLAAVQDRALGPGGFSVRMNNAAISGTSGGASLGVRNSQTFAHETGHAWTLNATGFASNFLHEAWATFVEGLMIRKYFTAEDRLVYRVQGAGKDQVLEIIQCRLHY